MIVEHYFIRSCKTVIFLILWFFLHLLAVLLHYRRIFLHQPFGYINVQFMQARKDELDSFTFSVFREIIGTLATSSGDWWDILFFVLLPLQTLVFTYVLCFTLMQHFWYSNCPMHWGAPFQLAPMSRWHDFIRLFLNIFIKIKFTHYTIHSFKVSNSIVFIMFTEVYNHHPQWILHHFHSPKKKSHTHQY